MADKTRLFNWNGGSSLSQVASSGTFPSYSASAPAVTSIGYCPGRYLVAFHAYNAGSVPNFLCFFDQASTDPSTGTVPILVYPMASNGVSANVGDVFGGDGRYFPNGIGYAVSSVPTSLVIASASGVIIDLQFS